MKKKRCGFTLIELTMVVAIIAILSTLLVPKFGDILHQAKDAKIKGQLGGLRGALTIYLADNGTKDLTQLLPLPQLAPTYISHIPILEVPGHLPSDEIQFGMGAFPLLSVTDWGKWILINNEGDFYLAVACMHQDARGKHYAQY
jgi:prepilin-type N-terminal cleavage/methylation domain-containing protein